MPTELFEAPRVVFHLFGIPITETVRNGWLVMGGILVIAFIVTRRLNDVPSKLQAAVELLVEGLHGLVASNMSGVGKGFVKYFGALMLYLYLANISGLFGIRPPTGDINVTVSLALFTFVINHYMGLKANGLGYIKGFFEPLPLTPLNILGELARPVSLSLRLFGNILGGTLLGAMVFSLVPIVLPAALSLYFDLVSGLIQAFIFTMLSMTFIALAME